LAGEFHYGGQAVIEGVMIRGKSTVGIAVRKHPPEGEIVLKTEPPNSLVQKYRWLNIPILRGTPALVDAMRIGMRALMYSADMQLEAENLTPKPKSAWQSFLMGMVLVLSLALGILLFVLLPNSLLYIGKMKEFSPFYKNLIEGALKIIVFLIYILLIARMPDVKRLFQYHGAEHMVINAFEHGKAPSVENAQGFSTIHVRCGSAFIALVLFVAIVVHLIAPWPKHWIWAIPLRIGLIIPIAGISYEILRLSASPKYAWLTRTISAPGLWLQRITTRPPTTDQIEVAVAALQGVLEAETANMVP
jgi:uncharacterized protein YqhQ